MKLSLNWLSEYVDIKGLSVDDIVKKIYKAGFEVEGIDYIGQGTNLIVGEVIECKDHPDSDHLHVTKINIGKEVLDIVCGAPNCRKGLKVIVAQVGAKLPEVTISKSKIRGVESNGMLCSLKELGIPESALDDNSPSLNGIEELDDSFKVGQTNILKKLGYGDVILDISIYANRPDCLSVFNMCKEIAAILNRKCTLPSEFKGKRNLGTKTSFKVKSKTKNCPYFLAKVVNKVTIKESPKWLKDHLKANGIKCINNLVDISNYVMLETGQPLHFYDLRCFKKREITVIDNYKGKYKALDGIDYDIEEGDLIISNDNKPFGIAGIMGGEESKVQYDTTSLLVEAALFNNAQIRRTSNRLGLQTEAAIRFSKGLEPQSQNIAMDRAIELLIKYADAKGLEKTAVYGKCNTRLKEVTETLDHLNGLIGKNYTVKDVTSILKRLDFKYTVSGKTFKVTIPSYRTDISLPVDLDEEIIRLSGIDDLKSTLPLLPQTVGSLSDKQKARKEIKNLLINQGIYETICYTLVDESYIKESLLPSGNAIKVLSPLSDNRSHIRTSLMNSLIETLLYNLDHFSKNVNLFEISKVYTEGKEEERLGIILNGEVYENKLLANRLSSDFYAIKGIVFSIFEALGYNANRFNVVKNELDTKHFHPNASCVVKMGNEVICILGKLHPSFVSDKKLKDVFYAEILLDKLMVNEPSKMKAKQISIYPPSPRDLSIVCKENVLADDLIRTVKHIGGNIVKDVNIFDIFRGNNIEEGYKSVSINIIYESLDETLKSDKVNELHQKIVDELSNKYQANIRK